MSLRAKTGRLAVLLEIPVGSGRCASPGAAAFTSPSTSSHRERRPGPAGVAPFGPRFRPRW